MRKLINVVVLISLIFSFSGGLYALGGKAERESKLPPELIAQNKVKEILDALVDAYTNKKLRVFMALVADDFTMDKRIFEDKIRKDFKLYHNISLRYSINNVTINEPNKMIYVSLNFTIRYDEIKTNKSFKEDLTTELIFKDVNGVFKLYSMKKPYMFGISSK